jgi:DNA-binding NarL/FixJ family response regulator
MTTTAQEAVASERGSVDHHDGPIRVFLVADVCVYRELLVDALASEDRIEVAGSAPADIAGMAIRMTEPDVVLVDASSGSGPQRVWALAAGAPAAKIVAVGISDDESVVLGLMEAGIAGYITAEQPLGELVEAVEAAANGELKCSPRLSAALARRVAAQKAGEAPRRRRSSAHPARTRDRRAHRGRPLQQADRPTPVDRTCDGQEPRPQHPRQAPRRPPRGGSNALPRVVADAAHRGRCGEHGRHRV